MTRREREILAFISAHIARDGEAPTLKEIGEGLGIRSRGTVHRYVNSLIAQGQLRQAHRGWRGLALPRKRAGNSTRLPFPGRVGSSGRISPATSQEINLADLLRGPDRYVLQVSGAFLNGAGIRDGDLLILRRDSTARNGDIVHAIIDNQEVALRRLRRHGDRFELVADNPAQTSLIYPTGRVHIQGVVVGQIRLHGGDDAGM